MGKRQNFYDTEMQALADTFGSEILARIPPAERMKGLSPEEQADMLARLPAEARTDMLARLSPQDRADMLARLSADERVKGLSPDERVKAFQGLSPAEIRNLSAAMVRELPSEVRAEFVRQLVAADNDIDT